VQTLSSNRLSTLAVWTHILARAIGAAILILFLVMGIAQVTPALFLEPQSWALFIVVCGFLVVWWNDLIGGSLSLVGLALFYGLNFIQSSQLPSGWVLPLCFLNGLLAVTAGVLKSRFVNK
jgi:hypothetical protein